MKWIVHGHPDIERRSSTETDCFVHSPVLVYVASSRVVPSLPSGVMFFLSVCPELFKSLGGYRTFGDPGGLCRVWAGRGAVVVCWVPHFVSSHLCPPSRPDHSPQSPQSSLGEHVHQQRRPRSGPRGKVLAKVSLLLGLQVPPLQEQESTCDGTRKLQGEESILGQETPDQRPLPGGPRQRHKSPGTEQVLEWLFISQEQPKAKKTWVSYWFVHFHFFSLFLFHFFGGERDGGPQVGGRVRSLRSLFPGFPRLNFQLLFHTHPPIFFNGYCSV